MGETLAEALLAVERSGLAGALRASRWAYPLVNAGHIAALGLLFGTIVAYDLRVLGGFASRVPAAVARALLLPLATAGLALALASGALLFSVKATEYAANPAFRLKLALIALGLANVAWLRLSPARARLAALASLLLWTATILAGRMIAFV